MRLESISFVWCIFLSARITSSMTSSFTVIAATKSGVNCLACLNVLLSYLNTQIPFEAKPLAISRNVLLGPIDSSLSFGPEPCTKTTPGKGPLPLGIDNVPGNAHFPSPTVTSTSLKVDSSIYFGGL